MRPESRRLAYLLLPLTFGVCRCVSVAKKKSVRPQGVYVQVMMANPIGEIMKVTRKIIEIDEELCNGCGQCIVDCAESALQIVDGKARLIGDKYCDGLGACISGCPTGALQIVERLVDDFDEEAVEELALAQKKKAVGLGKSGGCPSAGLRTFKPQTSCQAANEPVNIQTASALSHWPVQIRLVPPNAPFLRQADLLIAADCTTIAYAGFHQNLLKNKVVMMGCPKFDDGDAYVQKLSEIFRTAEIKSICVAIMEVPCCQNMKNIVKAALDQAQVKIPVEVVVVSVQGEIERGGLETGAILR